MLPCTLHVGAPKTGSTSIQEALFLHLRDPRFQYASGGEQNGSVVLGALYGDRQGDAFFQWMGTQGRDFPAFRDRLRRRFERSVDRARRRRAHLIISAEFVWRRPVPVLAAIRNYLNDQGFDVEVRGYVRPWRSWLTSWFHHELRTGQLDAIPAEAPVVRALQIAENCERLWQVFGRHRVHLTRFDPARFPHGCVVHDFCRQIGFPIDPGFRLRSNETLSLPALQMLHCLFWYGGGDDPRRSSPPSHFYRLLDRLRDLPGPPLRLHPDVLERWSSGYDSEAAWVVRELGFPLDDQHRISAADEPTVRTNADLRAIPAQALDWLAARTGQSPIRTPSGVETARSVAAQVDRLRRRPPSAAEVRDALLRRLRSDMVRLRNPC